jgi:hypothetical protein
MEWGTPATTRHNNNSGLQTNKIQSDLLMSNRNTQFNRSGDEGVGHFPSANSEHNYPKQMTGRGSEGPDLRVTPQSLFNIPVDGYDSYSEGRTGATLRFGSRVRQANN